MHMHCWLDRPWGRPVHDTMCGWFYWSLKFVFGPNHQIEHIKEATHKDFTAFESVAGLFPQDVCCMEPSNNVILFFQCPYHINFFRVEATSFRLCFASSGLLFSSIQWVEYETCLQCYCECQCHNCRRLPPHGSGPFPQGEPGVMVYPWVWFKDAHDKRIDKDPASLSWPNPSC